MYQHDRRGLPLGSLGAMDWRAGRDKTRFIRTETPRRICGVFLCAYGQHRVL